jgi:3'-phosphoadenosine 5'-phosphosulfate sulfotransferase (PAPS reductase)/FAD synthetase
VSTRTARGRAAEEALPGMPDRLAKTPPKAAEYQALTLDEAIDRGHAILDRVLGGEVVTTTSKKTGKVTTRKLDPPETVVCLFSGGGDSSILAHLMRERVDMLAHVDTGIAIPACRTYVDAVADAWGAKLVVKTPPDSYEQLVLGQVKAKTKDQIVFAGFPGPPQHATMYQRLKERALDDLRRELVGPRGRGGQVVFVAGQRWAESDRRFRNASETDPWGSVLWCSPIVWWTNDHMAEYRRRYLCHDLHEHAPHRLCRPGVLPRSEVTDHLHMSGDCLCGAYARPDERDEIGFFYPEVAERIRRIEADVAAAGIKRCVWGAGKQAGDPELTDAAPGPLCSRCVPMDGQLDLFNVLPGMAQTQEASC